jgi:hypothetical protein
MAGMSKSATKKQTDLILKLMPDFSTNALKRLSMQAASAIIDERLGKKKPRARYRGPRKNSQQVEACLRYGVDPSVHVRRDRLTPGVRTRTGSEAAGE